MNWMQILNTIIVYIWLFASLYLLWRILRTIEQGTQQTDTMARTITSITQINADAAQRAAESARIAAETAHNAVALQAKEQEPHG